MKRFLPLLLGFFLAHVSVNAQLLGVAEEPPAEEAADLDGDLGKMDRYVRSSYYRDSTEIRAKGGLFGISAKKALENAKNYGDVGYFNVALGYSYRALDKGGKTDEQARQYLTSYGQKFIEKMANNGIGAYENNNGPAGRRYADRLVREINKARRAPYKVSLALPPSLVTRLNDAGKAWSDRTLAEARQLASRKKYYHMFELLKVWRFGFPAAENTPEYASLREEALSKGVLQLSVPNFVLPEGGGCSPLGNSLSTALIQRLLNVHPLVRPVSREANETLEVEKKLAYIDDRQLTGEVIAGLQGSDYLVLGRIVSCTEVQERPRETKVLAYKGKAYSDTLEGKPITRYAYEDPIELLRVVASNRVDYIVSVNVYRISDGQLLKVFRQQLSKDATTDYIFNPSGVRVASNKVPPRSDVKPEGFGRQVSTDRLVPRSIEDMRRELANSIEAPILNTVMAAIQEDK